MPKKSPPITKTVADKLAALGQQIRARRKLLRISVTTSAEAAGMSRVTLHRIETGEPSVTMGAYISAIDALGLDFVVAQPTQLTADVLQTDRQGWIPARIFMSHYPQLKQLAWQVHGTGELTPSEAHSIYERNWRHINAQALEPSEQQLIDALRTAFGSEHV